jgi:hypothetical protein
VSSSLRTEASKRSPNKQRWINVGDSPFSRAFTYRLISQGDIVSVLLRSPGARRGRRLIDGDSLDLFLENLAKQQAKQKEVK